jgi:hypothetical protein
VAYFSAYVEMAGPSIPMQGIQLEDGYLWPDRAVVRSLLERGCLIPRNGVFVVTPEGELLLAPRLKIDGDTVVIVSSGGGS